MDWWEETDPEIVIGNGQRVHDLRINGVILQVDQIHFLTNLTMYRNHVDVR